MNNSKIVFLINDGARAVKATYDDGHAPDTFKTLDPAVDVGDLVVVESGTRHGMTVVKVTEVDVDVDFYANTEVKWVVQRIDSDGFKHILAQERDAIAAVNSAERRRKKEELRASLFADHHDKINALALSKVIED
jgi:hypothetical protein